MQIPSGTNYIDACALLMLLNKKDDLRTALGLKDKPAKSIFRKNLLSLRIPMPALGEALKKARDKGIDWDEVTGELDSLITEKYWR